MIKYQEKLQDFYKMRDTLIAEGFNYPENIEIFNKVEIREIALEIIKKKNVDIWNIKFSEDYEHYNLMSSAGTSKNHIHKPVTEEEYGLLKEVLL